jgi:hypothetical protein
MANKPQVTNTTDQAEQLAFLAAVRAGVSSSAVEAQEARGQRELVASDQIPVLLRNCTEADLTALGFVLGERNDDDPLFRDATLPAGWSKQPTSHSMWSEIVDDRGVVRFNVFYKAAFYDRKAFLSAVPQESQSP